MMPGQDRDRFSNASHADAPDARPTVSHTGQLARGIAAALACDTLFNVPSVLFLERLPDNVGNGLGSLLLGVNILVGYVGGRVAARAGLAHNDHGSQWTMSFAVTVLSLVVMAVAMRVQTALHLDVPHAAAASTHVASGALVLNLMLALAATLLLARFGFAIGTFVQAHREGRAHDEDESGAE